MSRRIFSSLLLSFVILAAAGSGVKAQTYGSYTPYSLFGVGDLASPGTAYNKTMGGVGIANRNHRFLNITNPAAVTARDTLSFMADYSILQDNKIFRQGDMRSASNTMNVSSLAMSFPIWKSSAMMVGIRPYSDAGYSYGYLETDPSIIGNTGNVAYTASGSGSLYQVFAAAGVTFWRRLSLGAEFDYHFGKIDKSFQLTFSDPSYNGATSGHIIQLTAPAWKVGIQYEQPLGSKSSLTFGATYKSKAAFSGNVESYRYSSGSATKDTLDFKTGVPGNISLASEKGVGLCYRYADKFMVEVDYTRADWRDSGMANVRGFTGYLNDDDARTPFTCSLSESYRVGVEYIPNRSDIRYYYKKIAYRAGAYWKKDYYSLFGNQVNAYGITIGATLPVFRMYNGITLGADFGQRGSIKDNMVRETYCNFSIGFNLHDIWFVKNRYE